MRPQFKLHKKGLQATQHISLLSLPVAINFKDHQEGAVANKGAAKDVVHFDATRYTALSSIAAKCLCMTFILYGVGGFRIFGLH